MWQVDATISQDAVSHTWTGYRFSQFSVRRLSLSPSALPCPAVQLAHQPPHLIGARVSLRQDWVSVFHGGTGTITIKDHASGKTLLTAKIPLTPGPLVVVVCLHCTVALSRARIHTAGWAGPADYDSGVASQPSSYSRGACSCLA